jgi:RNA polymerase sigma-70 factor (ECF subfamily)
MTDLTKTPEFLQLFTRHQRRIYAYIRAQVRSPADADDILQETSAVLWRKIGEFQPGTDFGRWACRVARLEILTHHRHHSRLIPVFSQQLQETLADELVDLVETVDARHEALAGCLEQLSTRHRELIDRRYRANETVTRLAQRLRRSESTVYKILSRIHDMLFQCVQRSLAGSEVDG